MNGIGTLFIVIAFATPAFLFIWWIFSSLGRVTRGIEDIAATLRRMEQARRGKEAS